jgi:hypothetical protein
VNGSKQQAQARETRPRSASDYEDVKEEERKSEWKRNKRRRDLRSDYFHSCLAGQMLV